MTELEASENGIIKGRQRGRKGVKKPGRLGKIALHVSSTLMDKTVSTSMLWKQKRQQTLTCTSFSRRCKRPKQKMVMVPER
jgi:hypothetical protein